MTERIRQAARHLAGLLRRRGTSPAVGKAIRRAVQDLDAALSGPAENLRGSLERAAADLRAGLELTQASPNPADGQQTEGIAAALGLLFPLLEPPPASAPAAPEPLPVPFVAAPAPLAPPASAPMPAPVHAAPNTPSARAPALEPAPSPALWGSSAKKASTNTRALRGMFSRLFRLHRRRLACVDSPTATFADLVRVEASLARQAKALRWVGASAVVVAREAHNDFEASEILVAVPHLGDRESLARRIAQLHAVDAEMELRLVLDALRFADASAVSPLATDLFGGISASAEALRSLLIPLLVELGCLGPRELFTLLKDESARVSVAAATAIATIGPSAGAMEALDEAGRLVHTPISDERAEAILFASVALGSREARTEVRTRVDEGRGGPFLIDSLAVAGDGEDANRLLRLACGEGEHSQRALLAVAHLGSRESLTGLAGATLGRWDEQLIRRVSEAIQGDLPRKGEHARPVAARLVRGRPWSVMTAMERLFASDEPLLSRRWIALDIGIRSGLAAPRPADITSTAAQQTAAVARFKTALTEAHARPSPGRWHYFGRAG